MTPLTTLPAILLALSPLILLTGAIALFNFTTFRAGLATLVLLALAVWGVPAGALPLATGPPVSRGRLDCLQEWLERNY